MTLPSLWKVRREVSRVKENIQGVVLPRLTDRLIQLRYDRSCSRMLRETPGVLPLTERVAVLVLFQPSGLALSTFLTIDHLLAENWSVVVISNAPLPDSDRMRLAEKAAHVIERPNIGYDFGAYREGWRWLERHLHQIEKLVLMNDSTWFPLCKNDDSLRRMEALNSDLAGHVFKNCHPATQAYDHLESHCLMLSARALNSDAMRNFFKNFLMSNSRHRTIWRGEIPISQVAIRAGLSVRALLDRKVLLDLLVSLDDVDLLRVARQLPMASEIDRQRCRNWKADAEASREWREDFLIWSDEQLSASQDYLLSAAFFEEAVLLGRMGFLKKSQDPRFQIARLTMIRGIQSGRIRNTNSVVVAEIQESIQNFYNSSKMSELLQ